MTVPFPMIELAVKELLESAFSPAVEVGGHLSYDGLEPYVWFGLVPGGRTTQLDGEWILDIDCFARSYADAMTSALALEALLIGPRRSTSVLRLDRCDQNEAPVERPWDDETAFRVGATYVFTARRPSSSA